MECAVIIIISLLLFQRIMLEKLKRIFENKRRTNNQQYFRKGERPKTDVADEGPDDKKRRNADDQRISIFFAFKCL